MTEHDLDNLIRMAVEAEAFESEVLRGGRPQLRMTQAGPEEREALLRIGTARREREQAATFRWARSGTWFKAGFALAACVALGWAFAELVLSPPNLPSAQQTRGTLADGGSRKSATPTPSDSGTKLAGTQRPRPLVAPGPSPMSPGNGGAQGAAVQLASLSNAGGARAAQPSCTGCVVVAIFRDSRDGCSCVHLQPHDFTDGRRLADHAPTDLLSVPLKGACAPSPDRILLVALEGPTEMLPRTPAEAESLVECVTDAPRQCDGSPACYASAASRCLPQDVHVLAQTVQFVGR